MVNKRYEKLGETVFYGELPNGLPVYVDVRPGYGKQFAFFATRYGGVDMKFKTADGWQDTPAGVAHFLEHKLFDTKDGNALQIMAANGADPNAFTSFGMTGYFFQCTRGFEENLRTLLGFVSEPYFTPESVAKEQGIIGQEIAMGDDEADTEVFYDLLKCLYAHHPVRTHIAGTAASIAQITDRTLYTCHGAFYNPGNMVLTVVGDVDPERVLALAGEIVTGQATGNPQRDYGEAEPKEAVTHDSRRAMAVASPLFQLGFKIAPPAKEELLRTRLVADLAGDLLLGESGALYAELYNSGLITKNFSYGFEDYPGCAFFALGGESDHPEQVRELFFAAAREMGEKGFREEDFRRLKRAAYGDTVSQLDSFEHTAIELAQGHLDGVDVLSFPEVFQSITPREVQDFIARWFTPEQGALAVITPGGEEA